MALKPFKKGKSGNPGGRPKIAAEVKELARGYTAEAIETLAAVMQDAKAAPAARVNAASTLLDRGYGKPTQTIDANVNILDGLSYAEQESLAAALSAIAADEGEASAGTEGTHH